MKISDDYARELKRKAFHCLTLVYLAVFQFMGRAFTLWALGAWILLEGAVEMVRLRRPDANAFLMRVFGGIHREAEREKISGVFWTSIGCWLTLWAFGDAPALVAAAFFYLALGDGAAALVGKAVGRAKFSVWGRTKSLEGSAACFLVCLAAGRAAGLDGRQALIGAAAATAVECAPVPIDDNLWLPIVCAGILTATG